MSVPSCKDHPLYIEEKSADIDMADFVYQSSTSIAVSDLGDMSDIADLIDQEIERVGHLGVTEKGETTKRRSTSE
ncbi:hypothetical protein [Metabacillus sp. SLBN-84]